MKIGFRSKKNGVGLYVIFCSAWIDCRTEKGGPYLNLIRLLHGHRSVCHFLFRYRGDLLISILFLACILVGISLDLVLRGFLAHML